MGPGCRDSSHPAPSGCPPAWINVPESLCQWVVSHQFGHRTLRTVTNHRESILQILVAKDEKPNKNSAAHGATVTNHPPPHFPTRTLFQRTCRLPQLHTCLQIVSCKVPRNDRPATHYHAHSVTHGESTGVSVTTVILSRKYWWPKVSSQKKKQWFSLVRYVRQQRAPIFCQLEN